ncbi:MAG: PhzF family phenazine biosynthesis protein [Burkholderiales bacterium]|nr:MAG: PhzF family phenazine biosynthesis protein [Betaproteobacteria bacterium]TAG28500.1 MAG: PhzF family phenazine biosynthesis protein [Burkholderiales bacterium]
MRQFKYRLVNVFVESDAATFGGNPLCVFEDARGMTDSEMQSLAAQFNLSETTFILPRGDAPPQVRIFTPLFEMPFAGHPTIGTAAVVHALGLGGTSLTLSMQAGDIPVNRDEATGAWTFTANPHSSRESGISPGDLAAMLGLAESDLAGVARYVDTGSDQLVIPVASLDALSRVKPNEAAMQQLVRTQLGRYLAYAVVRIARDRFQVRFFFPTKSGLTEDPGTGSACANLGGYLLDSGEATPANFTVTQGQFMDRLNVLQLSLTTERRIQVGGRVLMLGGGTVNL